MMKIELSLLLVVTLSSHVTIGLDVLCPPQWTQWRGGCYRFINNPTKNWQEAQAFCNTLQLSPGVCPDQRAHLVTIDSHDENDFVFNWWKTIRELSTQDRQYFWIDGNDIKSEGTFVLTNGKPIEYKNWFRGQPNNWQNQDCISMAKLTGRYNSDDGKWLDEKCHIKNSFMCEFRCC